MAMNKSDMASAIIDALKDVDKPADAMSKLSKAIKDYVEANCVISFSWIAMMPPPASTPDPVTSYKGEVKFPVFMLSIPPLSDPDAAMTMLGLSITQNLAGGMIMPKMGGGVPFAVPPITFLPLPVMLTPSKKDKQKDAMEHLCDEIISSIKKMINPIPLPGAHPPYVVPAPGAMMTGIE